MSAGGRHAQEPRRTSHAREGGELFLVRASVATTQFQTAAVYLAVYLRFFSFWSKLAQVCCGQHVLGKHHAKRVRTCVCYARVCTLVYMCIDCIDLRRCACTDPQIN